MAQVTRRCGKDRRPSPQAEWKRSPILERKAAEIPAREEVLADARQLRELALAYIFDSRSRDTTREMTVEEIVRIATKYGICVDGVCDGSYSEAARLSVSALHVDLDGYIINEARLSISDAVKAVCNAVNATRRKMASHYPDILRE